MYTRNDFYSQLLIFFMTHCDFGVTFANGIALIGQLLLHIYKTLPTHLQTFVENKICVFLLQMWTIERY